MSRESSVFITAFARLHLGFLNLNGDQRRQFGSIGLSLADVPLEISAASAGEISASGPGSDRAESVARAVFNVLRHRGGIAVRVVQGIPEHAGLGSGTQIALAVGTACARIAGKVFSPMDLAGLLMRGQRSGIGIGTFAQGGFVVDGGRGPDTTVPPVVSRLRVPESWRFVLVFDRSRQGAHGEQESAAFSQLPSMSGPDSAHLCRVTLTRLLPALAESDCAAFGAAVNEVQSVNGGIFAAAQAGRFTSPDVEAAVAFLLQNGATGIGQSSWGPTGFAVFASEAGAARALQLARQRWHDKSQLDFVSCRAANHPAVIRADTAARHAQA